MSTVKPISPEDIGAAKAEVFPDEVIEAFNELIAENFVGHEACVRQEHVVERMVAKGIDRGLIFDRGWLNVEDIYRAHGWAVTYDKPGYNESYGATFTFKKAAQ